MFITSRYCCLTPILAAAAALAGCSQDGPPPPPEWAINVGGPAYSSTDGIEFESDDDRVSGTAATLEGIKGSQDSFLYETYRGGDIHVSRAVPNGTYDVTLYFAEPADVEGGERLFDALIEGQTVVEEIDVMAWRDGKVRSALTVVVPGVEVSDGEMNISFAASAMEPVLSGVAVKPISARRANEYSLVWSDEFDDGFDESIWNYDIWPSRTVNDEDQAYTDREKNLRVEDGFLIIEAHREDYGDAKYTSGRVHSAGKRDILYGRIDVRAKLPSGKGSWPAIWMLPSDPFRYATNCSEGDTWQGNDECDAWPNSGEIDIMEHVGYQMGHVHGTVHNKAYYWVGWEQRKGRVILDDVDTKFHVYSLEWTPERIDVLVDDILYFTYVNEGDGWRSWPYDHAHHLILNIAVGGWWGRAGGGIDDSIFPQQMHVDYVRVYEFDEA
ncbi:MAG: family 16 glycosylhydrolase [Woeseiaceae bacterium]|nr:family 16 glycosylhydrolase [Woeseiaceae bacterium]